MDYDKTSMPDTYDKARPLLDENLMSWRRALKTEVPAADRIVDVGCGTGRFTFFLAETYGANVVGVDPSHAMISQAQAKAVRSGVEFRDGRAEAVPVADASQDLVFASMAFHHFEDRNKAAIEFRRIIKPGGHVMIRNSTREQLKSSPYAEFFDGFDEIVRKNAPSKDEISSVFVAAGFTLQSAKLIPHIMATGYADLAEKASHRADSLLIRLSETAFADGLARLREAAKTKPARAVLGFPIDLVTMIRR